jgi:enoyl-CoA hydratase/carnithine racemase
MLTYALGERTAARASLHGETFDQYHAYALGMFDELLPADQVLDRCNRRSRFRFGNRSRLTRPLRPEAT